MELNKKILYYKRCGLKTYEIARKLNISEAKVVDVLERNGYYRF